eukprot:Hpha_TRINITY_DN298_c0_g1::TRINITY_DN298_c0_g1_i1::g.83496::m.83496/K07921/RAB34; Ras-related protein Rab-34
MEERRIVTATVGYEGRGFSCITPDKLFSGVDALHGRASTSCDSEPLAAKIILCGSAGVGKTAMLRRVTRGQFDNNYRATIGVDFERLPYTVMGALVDITVWDTAGQERFKAMTRGYYSGADAIVLVYDVNDPSSFEDISRVWLPEIRGYVDESTPVFLVGNKSDLPSALDEGAAEALADAERMELWTVSVKDDNGRAGTRGRRVPCAKVFDRVAEVVLAREYS